VGEDDSNLLLDATPYGLQVPVTVFQIISRATLVSAPYPASSLPEMGYPGGHSCLANGAFIFAFPRIRGEQIVPSIFIFVDESLRNLHYQNWSREFSRLSSQCSEKRC